MLLAATAIIAAPPAAAQLGGIVNQAKKRAEREARDAAETAVAKTLFPLEMENAEFRQQSPHLDTWDFGAPGNMTSLERTATGDFKLQPGLWEFNAQSYCLKMGTHERTGGRGYLTGELTGKYAPYVTSILKNSYAHPDIEQRDIQVLLWSVLSGLELKNVVPKSQAAARALLTPKQYRALDGGAASWAPPELSSRARRKMPRSVLKVLDARDRLRLAAQRPGTTYEDLEQIAVLGGDPPRNADDAVPGGRWSWHPDGYHIRYFSERYNETRVQILVGEKIAIERDDIGRIVEMKLPDGSYIRASYRDDVEPYRLRKFPKLAAYAFASVEYGAPNPAGGAPRTQRYENQGFTWVTDRIGKRTETDGVKRYAALENPTLRTDANPLVLAQGTFDFSGARERAEAVRSHYDEAVRPVSDADMERAMDIEHYGDGARTITGSTGDRLDWIAATHERLIRALARATEIIDSLGESDSPTYDPASETGYSTATSHVQDRGISGRELLEMGGY
jgi:hypothetical protein